MTMSISSITTSTVSQGALAISFAVPLSHSLHQTDLVLKAQTPPLEVDLSDGGSPMCPTPANPATLPW